LGGVGREKETRKRRRRRRGSRRMVFGRNKPSSSTPPASSAAAAACGELRAAYHECFNRWYAEKFAKGQWQKDDCAGQWHKYRACLEVNLDRPRHPHPLPHPPQSRLRILACRFDSIRFRSDLWFAMSGRDPTVDRLVSWIPRCGRIAWLCRDCNLSWNWSFMFHGKIWNC
jgi:hypothetical protein